MFSLGIAVPIPNHKFDKPTFISASLSSSAMAGDLSVSLIPISPVTVYDSTAIALKYILKRGDTLTLTSSASGFVGYTEQVIVEKVDGNTVYFTEPLTYGYSSGNSVKGYGSGLPDNWGMSSPTSGGDFFHTTMKPAGGGYADDYGFFFQSDKTVALTQQTCYVSSRDFELPVFKEYCWYREGIMVRAFLSGANTLLTLGSFSRQAATPYTSYVHRYSFKPTAEDIWEEVNYTFKTAPVLSRYINGALTRTDRHGNVSLDLTLDAANWSYAYVCIDDIYMEHIRGVAPIAQSLREIGVPLPSAAVAILVHNPTDFTVGNKVSVWGRYSSGNAMEGEINYAEGTIDAISGNRLTVSGLPASTTWSPGAMVEEKNAGVYVFEEHPDMEGVSWEPVSNMALNRTSNNGLKYTNPSGWGERTSKVQLTLKFTNVAYTFYRKLKKFEDECKKGNLLNLHQNGDVPELKMPFIQGFMQLTGFTHDMWDRYKCSFTATFTEC